jgi:hypothetical protein
VNEEAIKANLQHFHLSLDFRFPKKLFLSGIDSLIDQLRQIIHFKATEDVPLVEIGTCGSVILAPATIWSPFDHRSFQKYRLSALISYFGDKCCDGMAAGG